jgi:hypothetical protein
MEQLEQGEPPGGQNRNALPRRVKVMAVVWAAPVVVILASLGFLAIRSPRSGASVAPLRRRLLVGVALSAAALVGARRWLRPGQASAPQEPGGLSLLARLGEIWRAMTPHASGAVRDPEAFEALSKRMETALGELKTQVERGRMSAENASALETALRERFFHIHRSRYFMATCYKMTSVGNHMARSRGLVEEQVKLLNELSKDGKLPSSAAAKARAAVAKELAFQMRVRELWRAVEGEQAQAAGSALVELDAQYAAGAIQPTQASTEAAQTLVSFTAKGR